MRGNGKGNDTGLGRTRVHVIFVGKEPACLGLFVSLWLLEGVDSRFRGNDRVAAVMAGKLEVKGQKVSLQS
jgi:hypothetical protein